MDATERLVTWLDDAYTMERGLIEVMERHAKNAEGHATVESRIRQHIEETKQQAQTVKECVEALGGKTSSVKAGFGGLVGAMQGAMNRPASDTMIKDALADYAAEHYEIAAYRALIVAAGEAGHPEIGARLEPILRQEEDMAAFIADHLPEAIREKVS